MFHYPTDKSIRMPQLRRGIAGRQGATSALSGRPQEPLGGGMRSQRAGRTGRGKARRGGRDELIRELTHRANNLLAVISAIAEQSLSRGPLEEARHAFLERLHALSRANTLLVECDWQGVQLADVAFLEIAGLAHRVEVEGPDIELTPTAVQSFALIVHELVANARRYGSLSKPAGDVTLRWTVRPLRAGPTLQLSWREHGGPSPSAEPREGFGLRLIRRTAEQFGRTRLDFDPDGFCFALSAPLTGIAPAKS